MGQILETTENTEQETLHLDIADPELSFSTAKQMAKEQAFERCEHPMILSWKNGKTGEFYPNYECGATDKPFWIRYAESRGANLIVDFNQGEYVFMILKM